MAVVEMTKIKLVGLLYHKESILDALQRTGCTEVVSTPEISDTVYVTEEEKKSVVSSDYDRIKKAIDFLEEHIASSKGKSYYPNVVDGGNFFVSYDEFFSISEKGKDLFSLVSETERKSSVLTDNGNRRNKLIALKSQLEVYSGVKDKFADFKDTERVKVFFGSVKQEKIDVLNEFLDEMPYSGVEVLKKNFESVIAVFTLKEFGQEVSTKLGEIGFTPCPFDYDVSADEEILRIDNEIKYLYAEDESADKFACVNYDKIKDLKILADNYKFKLEKIEDSEKFCCTVQTFILTGYFPKGYEEKVSAAVNEVSDAVFVEMSEPSADDKPPTLTKNGPLVSQAEFVTDMYSSPDYREMDPNKVVFFFFMLFMGVIMADVVYGLAMIVFGRILARRIKVDNGPKKLWNVIAISGAFTMLWGALFNSYLGFSLPFYNAILPNPIPQGNDTSGLMSILLMCLLLGVIQIAVGYFCKAINSFRSGDVAEGIFGGITWVIFFIGFIFAAYTFIVSYLIKDVDTGTPVYQFFLQMQMPGLIIAGGALFVAAVTAGRREKGFGKFTKAFGAVYGLINIFSDILSYARLFGLLLSGMIISQTFNDMGTGMFSSGPTGIALGVLVIIAGHIFNLGMGVLGAYIHDSRLQYIEFFSKFYTGEGEKFTPIGSNFEYIYLTK